MNTRYSVCDSYGFVYDAETGDVSIQFPEMEVVLDLEDAKKLSSPLHEHPGKSDDGSDVFIRLGTDRLTSFYAFNGDIEEVVVARDLRSRFIEFLDAIEE